MRVEILNTINNSVLINGVTFDYNIPVCIYDDLNASNEQITIFSKIYGNKEFNQLISNQNFLLLIDSVIQPINLTYSELSNIDSVYNSVNCNERCFKFMLSLYKGAI